MKRLASRFTSLILMIALIAGTLTVGGCGKQETTLYTYVPDFHTLNIKCDSVYSCVSIEDYIYLVTSVSNADGYTSTYSLYKVSLSDYSVTDISQGLKGIDGVEGLYSAAEGNLLIKYSNMNGDPMVRVVSTINGTTLKNVNLKEENLIEDNEYVSNLITDSDGTIYCVTDGGIVRVINSDMQSVGQCVLGENSGTNLFTDGNNKVYSVTYGMDGPSFCPLNVAAGTVDQGITLNERFYPDRYLAAEGSMVYMAGYSAVYEVNMADGSSEKAFSWVDVDVSTDSQGTTGITSGGDIFNCSIYTDEKGVKSTDLAIMHKMLTSEAPKRAEIVYGTMYLDSNIANLIIRFNKTHSDVHITVKQYLDNGDWNNYDSMVEKFNNDIVSGNSPDIIDLNNVNYTSYMTKGLFENLLPYMEKEGMELSDFQENVLAQYEYGKGLYGVQAGFDLVTVAVPASKHPGVTGWNSTEFMEAIKDVEPEHLMEIANLDIFLDMAFYSNLDRFIDWDTGRCDFNNQEFYDIMEYSKGFKTDEYLYNFDESLIGQLKNGKCYLLQCDIYCPGEYMSLKAKFDDDMTIIGYPSESGTGTRIGTSTNLGAMGISSDSKHKDEAWEFVSYLLSEEYQDRQASIEYPEYFPIRKSSQEKMFAAAMEPKYGTDPITGEYGRVPKETYYDVDTEVPIYEATEEDIQNLRNLIDNADPPVNVPSKVTSIFSEEMEYYYSGERSIEEAARIAANRIGLYVAENL